MFQCNVICCYLHNFLAHILSLKWFTGTYGYFLFIIAHELFSYAVLCACVYLLCVYLMSDQYINLYFHITKITIFHQYSQNYVRYS